MGQPISVRAMGAEEGGCCLLPDLRGKQDPPVSAARSSDFPSNGTMLGLLQYYFSPFGPKVLVTQLHRLQSPGVCLSKKECKRIAPQLSITEPVMLMNYWRMHWFYEIFVSKLACFSSKLYYNKMRKIKCNDDSWQVCIQKETCSICVPNNCMDSHYVLVISQSIFNR